MAGALVGALRVTLGIDTAAFENGLGIAQKRLNAAGKNIQAFGDKMTGIGKGLSIAVTAPLVLLGKSAFDAATNASDAIGQVNSALASMGPVAGRTSEQLQQSAKDLEKLSSFDDKEILRSVTANMLTFGNVAGEAFDRAQLAAVNLSARMGTDLQSSTIMIGKALNDPVKGLAALGRAGIQFTEDQKEMIKGMVAAGDAAGAQAIMLGELEKQFGGAAKAARDAAPGSDMINKWSDLKETIGEFVLGAVASIEPVINRVLDAFNNLSPSTKGLIVGFAAVAAAIGPLLIIAGSLVSAYGSLVIAFAPAIAAAGGVGAALAAAAVAAAPFIAAGVAIAAAWYVFGDKITPVLETLRKKLIETLGPKLQSLFNTVKSTLTALWNGPLGQMIRVVIGVLGDLGAAFAMHLGETLIGIISALVSAVEAGFKIIGDVFNIVIGLLTGDFSRAWEGLKSLVGNVITGVVNILKSLAPETVKVIVEMASAFATRLGQLASDMITMGRNIIDGLVKGILAAPEAVWNALKSVVMRGVDNIKSFLGIASPSRLFMTLGGFITDGLAIGITDGTPKVQEAMAKLGTTVADGMAGISAGQGISLNPSIDVGAQAGTDLRNTFRTTFADGIKAALDGNLKGFFQKWFEGNGTRAFENILNTVADQFSNMISGLFGNTGAGGGGGLGGFLGNLFKGIFTGAPGFALGGSFTVGGRPGRDANLVAFRATRGEHVQISSGEAAGTARDGLGVVNLNFYGPVSNPQEVRRSAAQAGAHLLRLAAAGKRGS